MDIMQMVATGGGGSEKGNMIIPGTLLLSLIGVITYHHTTQETYYEMSHFLVIILLQMMPLLALKMKIYACGDRLSLVPRVLVKTLLMHLVLALLRIAPQFMRKNSPDYTNLQLVFDVVSFFTVIYILKSGFNFQWSLRTLLEEFEVRNLVCIGLLGAVLTETSMCWMPASLLSEGNQQFVAEVRLLRKITFTAANYIDVLAFLPVVWTLYRAEADDDFGGGTALPENARRQTLLFFGFVVCFYSWDDVIDPLRNYTQEDSCALMAHAAHFALLLDFACFFIFQVWTPSSTKGEQLQGLLEQGYDQDD